MTRVLKLRPLCDRCERAEAVAWNPKDRRALCARCDAASRCGTAPSAPIAASSVVSALCARCATAPAALVLDAAALCCLCARDEPGRKQALRDSHVASSIAFDRMDFSSLPAPSRSRKRPLADVPAPHRFVDLSYFKTPVPPSVARAARSRPPTADPAPSSSGKRVTSKHARVSRGCASKAATPAGNTSRRERDRA